MTVAELIEKLQRVPQDADVLVPKLDSFIHEPATWVRYHCNVHDERNTQGHVFIEG